MYIAIEGLPKSGKTTVAKGIVKELKSKGYQVIMMKGQGQIVTGDPERWDRYNRCMHNVLHRLEELNPDLIIVHDRGFSEVVNKDKFDNYLCRLYQGHKDACVIVVHVTNDTRVTRTGVQYHSEYLQIIEDNYVKLLQFFTHAFIDNNSSNSQDAISKAMKFVYYCNEVFNDSSKR